jgi:3D (Asp-Asp-Asp) domain-containing protein
MPPSYSSSSGYAPAPGTKSSGKSTALTSSTIAILAGVFILGTGVGIAFSSVSSSGNTGNVATRQDIELAVPNPELCAQFGAAAVVTEMRVYQTLNPFTVYVSQPRSIPGCVLRSTNWSLLEQRQLVTSDQVRECRNRMNTFAFTRSIDDKPDINCVYQSNENQFLNRFGGGNAAPETEKF